MPKKNKFLIWCALIAIISFWMFASVREWLSVSVFEPQNAGLIIISVLLILALFTMLALGLIFFRGKSESFALGAVIGLPFLILFGISNLNLVGFTILIFFIHFAEDIVSSEIKERIKMNSRVLLRKGMSHFVVAIFILISFAAYQSPAITEFKNMQELPSATGEFIRTIVENVFGTQLNNLNPSQKNVIIDQASKEVHGEINVILRPYFQYAPPALAFGLFLILWGLGWFFIWAAIFLGMLIFQVLKMIKFFRIEERDAKAETIIV